MVAVVLRGGRGSQPSRVGLAAARGAGGGRPRGRPWIATSGSACPTGRSARVAVVLRGGRGSQHARPHRSTSPSPVWRSSSGAAVDRNWKPANTASRWCSRGGRPPGRPWIATLPRVAQCPADAIVAVVLRGGRGSQPYFGPRMARAARCGGRPPGRPWIATRQRAGRRDAARGGGRPPGRPWIATQDPRPVGVSSIRWRSSSGAAVDRNFLIVVHAGAQRGGGGRPPGRPWIATSPPCTPPAKAPTWRSSSGAAVDRNDVMLPCPHDDECSGGRPPGRPWIATTIHVRDEAGRIVWRSSSGAAVDRNPYAEELLTRYADVAVVLRCGRGSQPRSTPRRPGRPARWRSSSGAAVDRNSPRSTGFGQSGTWRSSSGAAVDRNYESVREQVERDLVAVVLRGGRGSQRVTAAR
ncbi:hypothetical protein DC74_6143 [Streptomyces noursei]|nr:hypothetical protein DC74_6143 [Streptomyces noursei]